jgi:hypothetical protein
MPEAQKCRINKRRRTKSAGRTPSISSYPQKKVYEAVVCLISEGPSVDITGENQRCDQALLQCALQRHGQRHCPNRNEVQCREIIRTWVNNCVL